MGESGVLRSEVPIVAATALDKSVSEDGLSVLCSALDDFIEGRTCVQELDAACELVLQKLYDNREGCELASDVRSICASIIMSLDFVPNDYTMKNLELVADEFCIPLILRSKHAVCAGEVAKASKVSGFRHFLFGLLVYNLGLRKSVFRLFSRQECETILAESYLWPLEQSAFELLGAAEQQELVDAAYFDYRRKLLSE